MRTLLLLLFSCILPLSALAQRDTTLISHRPDGRLESTYAVLHQMLRDTEPKHAYREGMSKSQYKKWQKGVRKGMADIMKWPDVKGQPAPRKISTEQKAEYTEETWECYPMQGVVCTFLVLRPLQASESGDKAHAPVPALLCIPGSGQTMRDLTKGMALDYVREGWIAVCVDNAAAGDQADQENLYPDSWDYDYVMSSRLLLELGWNWLGYTSFVDYQVLQWMKTDSGIDKTRIVVSGFSLGTEPMMVLGVMDKDIYAFVYNDFLCNTQERAIAMTALDERGRRSFPNSIRHLIPDYWHQFNFPDVCCALAPRPIIFTEGGLDRDFDKVRSAYRTAGADGQATCYHYARFSEEQSRSHRDSLPEGLTMEQYLPMVNVDAGHHYFKRDLILPWLRKILAKPVDPVQEALAGNDFTISVNEMTPFRFPSRTVSYGYSLALKGDSVAFYLPYMGEVYEPEFNNDGLDMQKPIYNYATQTGKKGQRDLSFRCRREQVEYFFRITLYPDGKAYIRLRPSNAQAIDYSGEIE